MSNRKFCDAISNDPGVILEREQKSRQTHKRTLLKTTAPSLCYLLVVNIYDYIVEAFAR